MDSHVRPPEGGTTNSHRRISSIPPQNRFDNSSQRSKLPALDGVVAQLVEHHNGIVGVRGSNPLGSTILELQESAFRVQNMDGRGQYFATPKIPQLAGAVAKSHATGPKTSYHQRCGTVLSETGFRSIVLHGAQLSKIDTTAMNIFCHSRDKNWSGTSRAIPLLGVNHQFRHRPTI